MFLSVLWVRPVLLSVSVLRWRAMVVLRIRRYVSVHVQAFFDSFLGFLLLASVLRWRAMVVWGSRRSVFVRFWGGPPGSVVVSLRFTLVCDGSLVDS